MVVEAGRQNINALQFASQDLELNDDVLEQTANSNVDHLLWLVERMEQKPSELQFVPILLSSDRQAILEDLSNNYLDIVEKIYSNSINLVTYGRNLKKGFENLFKDGQADCVIIENPVDISEGVRKKRTFRSKMEFLRYSIGEFSMIVGLFFFRPIVKLLIFHATISLFVAGGSQ